MRRYWTWSVSISLSLFCCCSLLLFVVVQSDDGDDNDREWISLSTIEGTSTGESSGYALDLTDEYLAIGSWKYGSTDDGRVVVYNILDYKQQYLYGPTTGEHFGAALALSSSSLGSHMLAVGSFLYENGRGIVRLYEKQSKTLSWVYSQTLESSSTSSWHYFGRSLAFSPNYLAVGATGASKVYVFSKGGGVLVGEVSGDAGDDTGFSVDMANNHKLVVGSPKYSSRRGRVRVYRLLLGSSSTQWSLEKEFVGGSIGDECGSAVAFSSDGNRIAIGSRLYSQKRGKVEVYAFGGNNWYRVGQTLVGSTSNVELGSSVQLDSEGNTLAIGAAAGNAVFVYKYMAPNDWVLSFEPSATGGFSLAMATDGEYLAIGSPFVTSNQGSTSLYALREKTQAPAIGFTATPSQLSSAPPTFAPTSPPTQSDAELSFRTPLDLDLFGQDEILESSKLTKFAFEMATKNYLAEWTALQCYDDEDDSTAPGYVYTSIWFSSPSDDPDDRRRRRLHGGHGNGGGRCRGRKCNRSGYNGFNSSGTRIALKSIFQNLRQKQCLRRRMRNRRYRQLQSSTLLESLQQQSFGAGIYSYQNSVQIKSLAGEFNFNVEFQEQPEPKGLQTLNNIDLSSDESEILVPPLPINGQRLTMTYIFGHFGLETMGVLPEDHVDDETLYEHECTWTGVNCDLDDQVVQLWLNTEPGRFLPTRIGNLVHLEALYLGGNGLVGTIPTELGLLTKLEVLYLSDNLLTGTLPVQLGTLSLKELYLRNNRLQGSIPDSYNSLSTVEILDLGDNALTGSLRVVTGTDANSGMYSLKSLILHGNELTGTIPHGLVLFDNLSVLNLANNQLSGTIHESLFNLKLKVFDVHSNNIAGTIPEGSSFAQADFEIFNVYDNSLFGTIPPKLITPSMNELCLGNNNLKGSIPTEIGLIAPEVMSLENNDITGSIPAEIGSNSNLKTFSLHYNIISGEIPTEIGGLEGLQKIYISHNYITGVVPTEIGQLKNLEEALLGPNSFSSKDPPEDLENLITELSVFYYSSEFSTPVDGETAGAFAPGFSFPPGSINDDDNNNNGDCDVLCQLGQLPRGTLEILLAMLRTMFPYLFEGLNDEGGQ